MHRLVADIADLGVILHTDTEALRGFTEQVVSSMAKTDDLLKIRFKLAHQAYAMEGFAPECQTT